MAIKEAILNAEPNETILIAGKGHENYQDYGNKIINFQDYNAQTIGIILLWLAAFLTIYTGYDYVRKKIHHALD